MLDSDLRAPCNEAWNVRAVDMYSAHEVGYMALQCPNRHHYHVQSEGVLIEILDEHNNECIRGEIGRVVVTVLHNFAMPVTTPKCAPLGIAGEDYRY